MYVQISSKVVTLLGSTVHRNSILLVGAISITLLLYLVVYPAATLSRMTSQPPAVSRYQTLSVTDSTPPGASGEH